MADPEQDGEVDKVLAASVHDVKYVMALLRGVQFANRATVRATAGGLSITVEQARTLLATAFIFKGIFDEYAYHPEASEPSSQAQSPQPSQPPDNSEPTAFEIPLNTLIECLNIFGTAGGSSSNPKHRLWHTGNSDHEDNQEEGSSNRGKSRQNKGSANASGRIDQYFGSEKGTGMRLTYIGAGYPLTLLMAEDANGPTATCEITTFEPDPVLDLDFTESPTVLKIILKSSWLRDALAELDPNCSKLTIIGNPPPPPGRGVRASAPPRLRLQVAGNFGSTEMDYPSDKEVLETCECAERVSFSYHFKHIVCTQRALQSSTKTSMRINQDGMLSLQLIMPTAKPRQGGTTDGFIEFRCLPLEDNH